MLARFIELLGTTALGNAVTSVILIFSVVALRSLFLRAVRQADWSSEQVLLRWTAQVRRVAVLVILLGLVVIWATELRTLAISVVAIAAAIVLATKELIMCISGSLVRTTSRAYTIGDRIEIDGVKGDVIDIGGLTTTVLEIGPGHRRTGRSVTLPNSLLLTKSLVNETFTDDYVLHIINVPLGAEDDWHDAEARLLAVANEAVAPFVAEARRHIDASARLHGMPSFSIDPSVNVQIPEAGKLSLALRLPARADERNALEQRILRRFLDSGSVTSAEVVETTD